jgi:heme-degrading monooxygenase HmoA
MFSNVTVFALRDAVAVDAVREWAEAALPTFRQEAGFQGLLLLGDETGNGGQIVTLWESQEAMAAALAGPRHPGRIEALLRVIERPTQRPHHVLLRALL